MEEDKAGRLGDLVADFYLHHGDYDQDETNGVNTAISWHAKDAIPDGALTVVVEYEDGLPLILAATHSRLYALDVEATSSSSTSGAQTRCRSYTLDPDHVTVVHRATYRSAGSFRTSTWEIQLPDTTVRVPGHVYANGEADEGELMSRLIVEALGWGK